MPGILTLKHFIFCTTLSIIVFLSANYLFSGSLETQESLAKELQSSEGNLADWEISKKAPFKYRPLFKLAVNGLYNLSGSKRDVTFFWIYWAISLSFFILLFNLVFQLFMEHGIREPIARLGLILFALSPPILFAYTLPVHTREDILGYCLLFLGLILCHRNRFVLLFVVSVLAVLTRETLLILPLFYVLSTRFSIKSVLLLLTCLVLSAGIRVFIGFENYDYWQGLQWNLDNMFIVAGFVFLSFHVLWLPYFILSFKDLKNSLRVDFIILFLILASTLLLGQANEIRLLFIFSPFLFIRILMEFDARKEQIKALTHSSGFRRFIVLVAVIFVPLIWLSNSYLSNLGMDNPYDIPLYLWLNAGLIYFALFIVSLPICKSLHLEYFEKNS